MIGVQAGNAAHTGQWVGGFWYQLDVAVTGKQVHNHIDAFGVDGQVHGSTDSRDRSVSARVPVRQVAGCRHLEGSQHTNVEVTAAHDRERVGLVEERCTRGFGHRDFAGVNQIHVNFGFLGSPTHTQHAIFGVQGNNVFGGQVVGYQSWLSDAEIDG